MRQQLREAPGPRCSEQAPLSPSAAAGTWICRAAGAIPGDGAVPEILPQPPPAKCCNSSVVIPAWCCDTDAWREMQAPASSHSRGCCSSLARSGSRSRGLVRAQPRLFLARLDERENAAGRVQL